MSNIGGVIEIKKRKLKEELAKKKRRPQVIKRLKKSIARHKREMKNINKGKRCRNLKRGEK